MTQLKPIWLGMVNAYLLQGEQGAVLMDTGMSGSWRALQKGLAQANCPIGSIKLVLLTHGDYDHAGNCARLQKEYGIPVALHEGDVPLVRDGAGVKRTATHVLMKLSAAFPPRKPKPGPNSFTPDILLRDGQSLAEYGADATVYHAPGHTKGSVVILTAGAELIVGDTLVNFTRPSVLLIEDFDDYAHSLALIKGLGAHTVYPGHGKPFAAAELDGIEAGAWRRFAPRPGRNA